MDEDNPFMAALSAVLFVVFLIVVMAAFDAIENQQTNLKPHPCMDPQMMYVDGVYCEEWRELH